MTASLTERLEPQTPAGRALCQAVEARGDALAAEARANDRDGSFARKNFDTLRDAGVFSACAPASLGGGDLTSLYDLALLISRIAERDPSIAIATMMHSSLAWYFARDVSHSPDPAADTMQRRWLVEIGARRMVVASSVAEPGTPPWLLKTTAVRSERGWRVSGRKVLVSISPVATHFYTRMRVETDEGPMLGTFMIPRDLPGVTVRDDWDGLGLRGSGSGEVVFDRVELPLDAYLPRGVWGVRTVTDDAGRAAASCLIVACYSGIAEAARRYAVERARANGGALVQVGTAARALLAELELRMGTIRGTTHVALERFDREITNQRPRSHSAEAATSLMKECVVLGMVVERAAIAVVDAAMQLCGGASFSSDSPLARMWRDVRGSAFMRPHAPPNAWADYLVDATIPLP